MGRSIKVTTEKVKAKGEELLGMGEQVKTRLQAVEEEIGQIEGCFQAAAARQLIKAFEEAAIEGTRQISALKAHLGKLQEIAIVYEEAEKENELVTADY